MLLPEPREGTRSRPPASAIRNAIHYIRWSEGRFCRHLGRVAASPEPGTSRARRPEAPDGVEPVGANTPTDEPETWVGWDSVDRPAVGTRNTHPLTARFPGLIRAFGGSAISSQLSPLSGTVTTWSFSLARWTLAQAARASAQGPLVYFRGQPWLR